MSKVLDLILELKADLGSNWQTQLDRLGIWPEVKLLYTIGYTQKLSNTILAFIVLAYDNKSGWIELHKDRWENKRKIWKQLGGEINDVTRDIIHNDHVQVNEVVGWFFEYQKDWRWQSVLTCFDFHSEMMRFGGFKTVDEIKEDGKEPGEKITKEVSTDKKAKGNLDKGGNIQKGIELRLKGEAMLEEIRKDYVVLDTVAEKEGLGKITDTINPESWAGFIRKLTEDRKKN
jgi:hypothetical protein